MDILYSYISVDTYVEVFRSLGIRIRKTKEEKEINIFLIIANAIWALFLITKFLVNIQTLNYRTLNKW